jgi:uncharacterized protein involved in tolerance to divalent cations
MTATTFVEVVLTCTSWQQAQTIADQLLEKRLVASAEFIDDTHGEASAVKLIMQTMGDRFEAIEAEIRQLHSQVAATMHMVAMADIAPATAAWLEDEIK